MNRISAASQIDNQFDDSIRQELARQPKTSPHLSGYSMIDPASQQANSQAISSMPDDFVIINAAQLLQKQPMNLSNYDQVLKLLPGDLEIIDAQPSPLSLVQSLADESFKGSGSLAEESSQQAALAAALWPHLAGLSLQVNQTAVKPNKTASKAPKGLQVYIKRLASIYYPVQQQLASLTNRYQNSSGNAPTLTSFDQQFGDQAQAQSSSSFSLSSLMPRPKIDLSKSNISKKLNKFRFKTSWRQEATPGPMKPPTPANEFNYDIFNNQLAQLEKQQRQIQSLESLALAASAAWPTQNKNKYPPPSLSQDTFNYLPNLHSFGSKPHLPSVGSSGQHQPIEDQQAIDSINQQTYPNFLYNTNQVPPRAPGSYQIPTYSEQWQQPRFSGEQMTILSSTPNASHSMSPGQLESLPVSPTSVYSPTKLHWINNVPHQSQNFIGSNPQEPAIFITRLPQAEIVQTSIRQQLPFNQATSQDQRDGVAWPGFGNIHESYTQSDRPSQMGNINAPNPFKGQTPMFTSPSMSLTTHQDDQAPIEPQKASEVDSTNDSSRSAYFESRKQPPTAPKSSMDEDEASHPNSDHMLAIERFSKMAFERQIQTSPSVEQVDSNNGTGYTQVRRFPQFSRQQQVLVGHPTTGEILDVEQSVRSTETHRVNGSDVRDDTTRSSDQIVSNCLGGSDAISCRNSQQTRIGPTGAVPSVLVQPNGFDFTPNSATFNTQPLGLPITSTQPSTEPVNYSLSPTESSTSGPLIPSIGPQSADFQQQQYLRRPEENHRAREQDGTVLRSNLIEPLSSTLVPPIASDPPSLTAQLDPFQFDTSPFTPIQLTSSQQGQIQSMQHNLPGLRLRSSPLFESMISSNHDQLRPEPPVQVASYLANRLMHVGNGQGSSQDMQSQTSNRASLLLADLSGNSSVKVSPQASELIILKPATLAKHAPQTYLLRPQYLATINGGNEIDSYHPNEVTSAQLAGHLFDRLSSLSSPPSTSIVLDPLQAASTIISLARHANENGPNFIQGQFPQSAISLPLQVNAHSDSTKDQNKTKPIEPKGTGVIDTATLNSTTNEKFAQHRQSILNGKQLIANFDSVSQNNHIIGDPDNRLDPGGDGALNAILGRDNKTDNAILSHVMSLISSNAMPNNLTPFQMRNQRSISHN